MMTKNTLHFNRLSLLLVLLLMANLLSAQTLLYSEDFNNCALPADWTVNTIGNPNPEWYVGMPLNPNSDGSTIDGSCMLIIDDDATGNNTPAFTLQLDSPTFDGLGYESLEFSIDVHFRNVAETSFKIYVSDGVTYNTLVNYQGNSSSTGEQFSEFVTFTADLSFYASDNMSIRIEYDDDASFGWWAGVDNISITGVGSATNVFTQTFNDCTLPADWSINTLTGLVDWQFGYITNDNAWESSSMNGSCMAYFDDDGVGQNTLPSTVRLYSPVINGAEFANFNLEFDLIFRKYADLEHFAVYVFDGTEHHLVESYFEDVAGEQFNNYESISLNLSPFRSEQMQVVFHYEDGGEWGWWVGLDNVKLSGSGTMNDLCSNAFTINPGETCLQGNNLNAIFSGDPASCYDDNVGSLWYHYPSTINGIIKIETAADFNDLITVFTGSCTSMTEVDCNNRDEHGFTGETHYMNVSSGTDYYIRVNGIKARFGLPEGSLCISLEEVPAFPVPPVNDDCNNAISITVDALDCITGSNQNANFNGPEPSLNLKTRSDIWYSFMATAAQLEIKTQADFADVITVYSGNCNNLTEFAMDEFGQSLILNDLTVGAVYYVQVGGFFATIEGAVCMTVETPIVDVADNDLCGNATTVNVDGPCVSGNNTYAEFDGPAPSCEIFPMANVWYQFTAPLSGGVLINTGTNFPHVVAIYSGDCNNFEELLCMENPTYCEGYFQLVDLVPSATYFMQIASAENNFGYLLGDLCLSILDIGSTATFDPLEVIVDVNCVASGVAVLEVTPLGGQGNYTIQGNNTGDTLLTGATYLTVLTDEEGCEVSLSGVVSCGDLPCVSGASILVTDASCFENNDGVVTVDVSNGTGDPYSYFWSDGSTSSALSNLTAGFYFVTVTDIGGCSETFAVTVAEPAALMVNASATGETGTNANNGTATANPSGGTAPYTYLWSSGESTATIENLTPGSYSVTTTDANGCSSEETVIVSSFDCMVNVSLSSEDISCFGSADGQATAMVANGTEPYLYTWSTGDTTASIQNLESGTYVVSIQDANFCPGIATVFIGEPELLVGSVDMITNVPCYNTATGSATLGATGGVAPYEYQWPGGATGTTQTDLSAGSYTVTLEDANGCAELIVVEIEQADELISSIAESIDVTCFGNDDGSATVFAQGGTPGYTYLWNDDLSQTTASAGNLPPGNYTVTVTDDNGCTSEIQTIINEPTTLSINIDNIVNEVDNMGNGSIEVSVGGGLAPYQLEWMLNGNSFSTDEDLFNLDAGTYTLLMTDSNDCAFLSQEIVIESIVAVNDPELENAVQILPNPTGGKFSVEIDLAFNGKVQIGIYDILGRQLVLTDEEVISEKLYPFDFTEMAAGVYPVRVYLDNKVLVKMVVVE